MGFSGVKVFYIWIGDIIVRVLKVKRCFALLIILLILGFLCSFVGGFSRTVKAEEVWSQTYGGSAADVCFWAVETADGGYALVGHTYSFGLGEADIWLVKTDSNGNLEWDKTFGTQNNENANHLITTDDGGYLIVGTYTPIGFVDRDVWVIKTDSAGDVLWNKTYGGSGDDKPWRIIKTSDNGYAIAGRTSSFSHGLNDYLLYKIDSNGNLQWNTTLGGAGEESARGILETPDRGFLLTGWSGSYGAGELDYWLVKTDENGNLEWSQTYGGAKTERALTTIPTTDGDYIIIGNSFSFSQGRTDIFLVKIDHLGNQIWTMTFGGELAETPYDITRTSDKDFAVVGRTYSFGAGDEDGLFIKIDSNGNLISNQTYGGELADSVRAIFQEANGGYVIAGTTSSFGQGESDFWLIKTEENREILDFLLWIVVLFVLVTAIIVIVTIFRKRK